MLIEKGLSQLTKCPLISHSFMKSFILTESNEFPIMFVDPRFEDDALSALMEEAFSQTEDETKFDVDAYFNSDIDY